MRSLRGYFSQSASFASGPLAADLRGAAQQPPNPSAIQHLSAIPYYNALLRTTCVATMLAGGHAPNALPQSARATVNCRIFPGEDPEEVRKTLERVVADPNVKVTPSRRENRRRKIDSDRGRTAIRARAGTDRTLSNARSPRCGLECKSCRPCPPEPRTGNIFASPAFPLLELPACFSIWRTTALTAGRASGRAGLLRWRGIWLPIHEVTLLVICNSLPAEHTRSTAIFRPMAQKAKAPELRGFFQLEEKFDAQGLADPALLPALSPG